MSHSLKFFPSDSMQDCSGAAFVVLVDITYDYVILKAGG